MVSLLEPELYQALEILYLYLRLSKHLKYGVFPGHYQALQIWYFFCGGLFPSEQKIWYLYMNLTECLKDIVQLL